MVLIMTFEVCFLDEIEVNILYEPTKELVILRKTFFSSFDDIARYAAIRAGGRHSHLYWTEGVVFLYYPLQTSTEITARILVEKGRRYWVSVVYALMPKYQSIIETKERIIVPVINMSSNAYLRQTAKWLKDISLTD